MASNIVNGNAIDTSLRTWRYKSHESFVAMASDNTTNATLQIVREFCSDGVENNFIFSCLTLHLALQSSRVFKASSTVGRRRTH
jgi:hypothetical protein